MACENDADLPQLSWVGEHIAFGEEEPASICGGTLANLDRRTGEVLDILESENTFVDFYLLNDLSSFCADPHISEGCARAGVVYSRHAPHMHEVVHARSGDRLPLALEEGLATYLGDGYPVRDLAPRARLAELLNSPTESPQTSAEYGRAAHFIAYLAETFEWDAILALDAALGMDSTVAEIDAAFSAVTGSGTNELLTLYDAYADCEGFVNDGLACAGDPVFQFTTVDTIYSRTIDCAAEDALGPFFDFVYTEDVIELGKTIAGTRIISGFGDGFTAGGFAVLRRCGPCSEGGVLTVQSDPLFVTEESSPPGRYTVRFYMRLDSAPTAANLQITG